jgi:hypothetical protein
MTASHARARARERRTAPYGGVLHTLIPESIFVLYCDSLPSYASGLSLTVNEVIS